MYGDTYRNTRKDSEHTPVFTAAKKWKQPKSLSTDEETNKMRSIHTMECSPAKKKTKLRHAPKRDEPWKRPLSVKRPVTQDTGHTLVLHGTSRGANPWGRNEGCGCQGLGEGFPVVMGCPRTAQKWWWCNTVNSLHATLKCRSSCEFHLNE